jgi:hypothetical protein
MLTAPLAPLDVREGGRVQPVRRTPARTSVSVMVQTGCSDD